MGSGLAAAESRMKEIILKTHKSLLYVFNPVFSIKNVQYIPAMDTVDGPSLCSALQVNCARTGCGCSEKGLALFVYIHGYSQPFLAHTPTPPSTPNAER